MCCDNNHKFRMFSESFLYPTHNSNKSTIPLIITLFNTPELTPPHHPIQHNHHSFSLLHLLQLILNYNSYFLINAFFVYISV